MTIYNYVALKENKETVQGKINAPNIRVARAKIRELNLLPISILEETKVNFFTKSTEVVNLPALSMKDKINFTSTFNTLTQAGVPIMEALIFIENDSDTKKIKMVTKEIRRQIIAGSTFADTIAKYPHVFGTLYIGLAKAGEDSGELEKTLGRVITLLKKQQETNGKVISALIYPMFVVVLAIGVITVMLAFVFPKFKDIFEELEAELPLCTQLCLDAGDFLTKYWYYVIAFWVIFIIGCIYAFKTPSIRKILDRIVLKIPLFSQIITAANFANFTAVLQISYDAGIPIVDCLYLAIASLTNDFIKTSLEKGIVKVQQGTSLSAALKSTGIVPKMILFMIATGEQSGRLGELLEYCCEYIEKELDKIIDTLTRLIEPVLLVVLGGIVLFMAMSLYLPLFQSYSKM